MNSNSYTIAPGDTLSGIAAKGGYKVSDILAANPHITDPNRIFAGTSISLPGKNSAATPATPGAVTGTGTGTAAATPVVQPGTGTASTPATQNTNGAGAGGTSDGSAPDYGSIANEAGAAGLGLADLTKLFGPTADEQTAAKDKIAQQFGYKDSTDFYNTVFAKPTQTTEQFYNDAYTKAGLPDLLNKIQAKKDALNSALGTVNDNPWYDEAFRRGEASRLQTLANADIKNYQDDYNARLGQVHNLVTQHADDLKYTEALNTARLNYLQSTAEANAAAAASARVGSNLGSYVTGKQGAEKPQTLNVPGSDQAYQWNPTTKTWTPLNPPSPTGTDTGTGGVDYSSFLSGLQPQGQQSFAKLTTQDKANVSALLNGDALLSDIAKGGVQGTKESQRLLALARQVDPTFSETANKQRYKFKTEWNDSNGKAYVTRDAINTGLGHLAELKTIVDQLNNGDFQKANSIGQYIESNINGPQASTIAKFNQTLNLLAPEIVKAYTGGVPDVQSIQDEKKALLTTSPKNVQQDLVDLTANLMSSKLAATANNYKNIMGNYPDAPLINPDVLNALIKSGVDTSPIENVLKQQGYSVPGPIEKMEIQGKQPGDIINALLQPGSPVRDQVLAAQRAQYSPEEIIDHLKKASSADGSSPASAMNSGGQKIVAGYDLTGYATDPNHATNVQKIYSAIPNITSARDASNYILSVAPSSPIRGSDVIAAAQKYNVDPKMVLAIMQQDSSLGTRGLATKTFNPGNVGNTDSGAKVNYGTWTRGIHAVAQVLAKRKLS